MSIVKSMPRMGNVLVNPSTGDILYAGSQGFNHSMRNGAAAKIWFQVPAPTATLVSKDDCFATFDVESGTFNVSQPIVIRHAIKPCAIQAAQDFANKVRSIAVLRDELLAIPHGKI